MHYTIFFRVSDNLTNSHDDVAVHETWKAKENLGLNYWLGEKTETTWSLPFTVTEVYNLANIPSPLRIYPIPLLITNPRTRQQSYIKKYLVQGDREATQT